MTRKVAKDWEREYVDLESAREARIVADYYAALCDDDAAAIRHAERRAMKYESRTGVRCRPWEDA